MTHPTQNGPRVSQYAILRQLGHGNLTRFFLATPHDRRPTELVVLELLQSKLAEDDDFRALFLDQAATTLALRHPNVVETHDVFDDPEACGLTMEFLEGQTLARVLEHVGRLRFPVDLHLHILSKVLHALEHAHALGGLHTSEPLNLHRDVCPSNVFLTYDGGIKLLGTGFADVTRGLEGRLGRSLVDVKYAAPEVLLCHPAGPRADLFSVGTMLWEAVTRQARSHADPAVVIRKRTNGQEPDLESVWADAPLPLIEVCARALAVSPRDRYTSAWEMRTDLDAYLGRASECSEDVLGRLPALMQSWFAAERGQMQRFISSSLELAQRSPESMSLSAVEDELTADDEEWTAQTSTGGADPLAAPADDRAGMPHRHTNPADMQQVEVDDTTNGRAQAAELPSSSSAFSSPFDASRSTSSSSSSKAAFASASPPSSLDVGAVPARSRPFDVPPTRESTTGGHRAYSSNLDTTGVRRSALRLGPDVLGAAALLLGSLVAVYSLYRHSTHDKRPESRQLAIQAEEPPASPTLGPMVRSRLAPAPAASGGGSAVAAGKRFPEGSATMNPDAGASEARRAMAPAFFDGESATRRHEVERSPLVADDLPPVDSELSSLQDAILTSARAKRATKARRDRAKKGGPGLAPESSSGRGQLRPLDDADL